MVFSSSIFLFVFLPLVLLAYFCPLKHLPTGMKTTALGAVTLLLAAWLLPGEFPVSYLFIAAAVFFTGAMLFHPLRTITDTSWKNTVLLIASLIFYAWGEPVYILLLLFSIIFNHLMGLWVSVNRQKTGGKLIMILTVAVNVSLFFIFKYLGFACDNLNLILDGRLPSVNIALPIGISFFTFQALSYVADVYRGDVPVEKNPLKTALYIALFPQLIAGPIIRYRQIAGSLSCRRETFDDFAAGTIRFTVGLGKKMIIANACGYLADQAFAAPPEKMSVLLAYLGAFGYTFQIYFDFSGYSDMAIGLGRMFGFHFPENFNFPYIARSITDFWRRWHISLSGWFRDYVYIPLGGNRTGSKFRMLFNLLTVWLLTGIWHGANWTFICWGLGYFILLTIERAAGLNRKNPVAGWFYTMPCVIALWVLFRSPDIAFAFRYLKTMCFAGKLPYYLPEHLFLLKEYAWALTAGAVFSIPVIPNCRKHNFFIRKIMTSSGRKTFLMVLNTAAFTVLVLLLLLGISFVVKSTNNPFIYFNF